MTVRTSQNRSKVIISTDDILTYGKMKETSIVVLDQSTNPVSQDVYRRWKEGRSYYALVELVDAHLVYGPTQPRTTRCDVLLYLGTPNWVATRQHPDDEWGYEGRGRHIPYADKVIFTFNRKDELIDICWVMQFGVDLDAY